MITNFRIIKQFLNFADIKNYSAQDKLGKLQPLLKTLKWKFEKYFQPVQQFSYDDSMVEWLQAISQM